MGHDPKFLICNCEHTMPLDGAGLEKMMGERMAGPLCSHLCRREIHHFQNAVEAHDDLIVACTQEAPLFGLVGREISAESSLRFFNIRELAGWSAEADEVLPKIASLAARAALEGQPTRSLDITSDGMCLIYGDSEETFEIARQLKPFLPVSVLMTDGAGGPAQLDGQIPFAKGKIERVEGSLGRFQISVADYSAARVSSRGELAFETPSGQHLASASLILDMRMSGPPLRGGVLPTGMIQASAKVPELLHQAILGLIDLKGTFEKPLYVSYRAERCAHSANSIQGCTKCIDHCPLGAAQSAGAHVAIDPQLCEGCGACAALCPGGAISYDYPHLPDQLKELAIMAKAYFEAGGVAPELLIYARTASGPLIEALARHGRGLPARVIPFDMHQVMAVDHLMILTALLLGFARVRVLASPRFRDELAGLESEVDLATRLLAPLFPGAETRFSLTVTDDPDELEEVLWPMAGDCGQNLESIDQTEVLLEGEKRQILRLVMHAFKERSGFDEAFISLEAGAPYGEVVVDQAACTLCLACVSACPTGALGDQPDQPQLNFKEISCLQCGLCQKTCPENAISLKARYGLDETVLRERVLHEEAPFHCIRCGAAFGVRSTIEKITETLANKHWMFENTRQIDLIKMCDQCRVISMAEDELGSCQRRPPPRTGDN